MASFKLCAYPAWRYSDRLGSSIISRPMESIGAAQRIEARNLAAVTAAVSAFGKQVSAGHPDASFSVAVIIARGGRKPNGFDTAYRHGGLGTEAWMEVRDRDGNKLADPVLPAEQAGSAVSVAV
jgi:hypothetical protein